MRGGKLNADKSSYWMWMFKTWCRNCIKLNTLKYIYKKITRYLKHPNVMNWSRWIKSFTVLLWHRETSGVCVCVWACASVFVCVSASEWRIVRKPPAIGEPGTGRDQLPDTLLEVFPSRSAAVAPGSGSDLRTRRQLVLLVQTAESAWPGSLLVGSKQVFSLIFISLVWNKGADSFHLLQEV